MFRHNINIGRKLRDTCVAFNIVKATKIMTVILWGRTPYIPVSSYQRSKKKPDEGGRKFFRDDDTYPLTHTLSHLIGM